MSFSQRLLLKAAWRLTPVLSQIKTPRKPLRLRGVLRKEGDSNPRYAFDVYTLSRRASSATRAPFLTNSGAKVLFFRHLLVVVCNI